ncbi:MAG: nitrous oxide reductase accessory protein NosL [Marinoscillum sp.]|uniref:nitrous oxide reductase accessory protein NosL n=1 Tax=Marinoscillum sp. TaxID=2024838 RepID=UPI0032FB145C
MIRYLVLLMYLMGTVGFAQRVNIDKDLCKHCGMLIRDGRFVALAVDAEKETQTFDAIECLVNYLKVHDEVSFSQLWVADYSRSNEWIAAKEAFYLESSAIPSPMGAYLSAYPDRQEAQKIQKQKGGDIFTWTELLQRFEGSRFGVLNHPDHHHRGDAYGPIGIMGDHVHHSGGWMVSVRSMQMQMSGNQAGTKSISNEEVYAQYHAAPQQMWMSMYMLGVMYAPTDQLTLAVMQSLICREMDMNAMDHEMMSMSEMSYQTKSFGLGDLKLSALYSLIAKAGSSFHLNIGISLPTGAYDQSDDTPMSDHMRLPYAMQIGSGTPDLNLGATYKVAFDKTSVGVQPMALLRIGENRSSCRLGHQYRLNGWFSYTPASWLALVGRTELILQQSLSGIDPELNPMMSPPANVENYGSEQVNAFAGVNIGFPTAVNSLKKLKLGLELGTPIYLIVRGNQMKESFTYNSGISYML